MYILSTTPLKTVYSISHLPSSAFTCGCNAGCLASTSNIITSLLLWCQPPLFTCLPLTYSACTLLGQVTFNLTDIEVFWRSGVCKLNSTLMVTALTVLNCNGLQGPDSFLKPALDHLASAQTCGLRELLQMSYPSAIKRCLLANLSCYNMWKGAALPLLTIHFLSLQ